MFRALVDRKSNEFNNRILLCDDNQDLHKDYLKILCPVGTAEEKDASIREIEEMLFDDDPDFADFDTLDLDANFRVDSAFQGREAFDMVKSAAEEGDPYTVVFMDVRMPPGWDGVSTVERIWKLCPDTEVVLVTAYSDYSWSEMINKLGVNDKLLYIKKPFDSITIKQLAFNLTNKWNFLQRLGINGENAEEDLI